MADKIRLNTKYDLNGDYEPSDSEEEYSENEKRLLKNVRKGNEEESESEEEVYGFSESDSDKNGDIAESDIEGQDASEDDLPDARAWGQKKNLFYSTDYVDEDYGGFGKDEEAATREEQEARILQTKLAQHLEDDDFSLEFFTSKKQDESKNEKHFIIQSDLSQMSKRQKLELLQKESPEFNGLVDDFKVKLNIAKDKLLPVLNLFKDGTLPHCQTEKFIKTQYGLILNYCINISFYLTLKVKKISIQNHPVIKRLYQYKQMLNQIEPIYESTIEPQISKILDSIKDNETIRKIEEKPRNKKIKEKLDINETTSKKNKKKTDHYVSDEEDDEDVTMEEESNQNEMDSKISEVMNESADGEKRAITYQMAKNKGLTPHRKKEQRNPRVKHRNKYRKAKIRRKGAIREVRTEMSRYGGEASGIKANVKKSIKIV